MDNFSFASLAYVRILLLPVGLIPQTSFESYAAEIRSFESIRLGEIPADTKGGKVAQFLPNPLSTGHLHISFPTHPPPQSHALLSLLRPSHFPLAVIGIAKSTQVDSLPSLYSQFNASLADIFPHGGLYPLAKNCFVFEDSEGTTNFDPGENMPGLVVVPRIANRKLHIGTLLGVLCSHILAELGVLVQALESPLGNEYLNSSLMPLLPPLSDLPSPLNSLSKNESPPSLASRNSQPEISKPFTLNAVPTLKRHSSTTASNTRQPNLAVQTQKKRLSTIGISSSHGRLYKTLGDFFLLAGRTDDAMIWYNEALQLFRTSYDPVWHACTLEGIATAVVIEAWSSGQGLNNSAAAIKEVWLDIGDRLQQAAALFIRTPAPDGEQMHSLLAFLYSGCVLRHSSLLFAVWSAKGWGPLAFTTLLQPGPKPCIPPTLIQEGEDNWLNLERLSLTTGIARSSISLVLTQLHGPWLLHLGPRERIAVLENMASLYACLGYKRKEVYILREVLGCLLDLMVCGREEDGYSHPSSVPVSAGLGIHNYHPGGWETVGVRVSESAVGNDSILKLLTHVCRVLGINLEAVALEKVDHSNLVDRSPPSLNDYDEDIIEELREPCGWPELQVGVVREAVAVAEALPDFPAVAQFALSALKTLQVVLSPGDQYHLYSTARRALMTAHRRGDTRLVEYWSGRPIVSISIAPLSEIRLPIEKPRSIRNNPHDVKPLLQGLTDPFLYNPRKVDANKVKSLVVQNDVIEFVVTLQNPYIFDLELQELSLSTSGVQLETEPIRVVIPANSLHQVILSGKAVQSGRLVIRGCFVIAPGGLSREYILPLHTVEEEQRLARKRRSIISESGRSKYVGLDRYPWIAEQKRRSTHSNQLAPGPSFRFLECKVVPEQPLLRIRRTSVTHGGLMLYDGEKSVIRVTLENVSPITVDFLHFGFEDSTMEPSQKSLAEGNLSVFDTYETEHSLINNPVFSWDQREAKTIAPNQNLTLTLTCFGKVGCTNGVIHISYAHIETADSEDSNVFYMRQVSYPLMVTVYHMLECSSMDILAFPSYSHSRHRGNKETGQVKYLNIEEESGWCLFSIEVRNSYGSPFDVTLVRTQKGESSVSSTTTIAPGSLSRFVIPIRKIVLDEEALSKPIPTLSDRQFVVAHSNLSHQEQRTQRELFWYREELFKCVRGRWHETGGTRSGELSFRAQRMTLPMLETFRLEIAQISLSLDVTDDPVVIENSTRQYQPNEFVYLRVKVTNLSVSSVIFTMDLEVNPPEYVIHEGVITDLAIGRLKNGESREVITSLCFLASGRFDISAAVRCFGTSSVDNRTARAHTIAVVKEMK